MPDGGQLRLAARNATIALSTESSFIESRPQAAIPAGEHVVLSVCDNGTGMDEAALARAADPFFTTKGLGKGTGLGLSMVHGFALQSGGALLLSSQLGVGTVVEIWLPGQPQFPGAKMRPGLRPLSLRSTAGDRSASCWSTTTRLLLRVQPPCWRNSAMRSPVPHRVRSR